MNDKFFKKPKPSLVDGISTIVKINYLKSFKIYNNNYTNNLNHRAVVKVMGGAKNYSTLCRNIDYITRNGKVELITADKLILQGKGREKAKEQFLIQNQELKSLKNKFKQTHNIAFSLSNKLAKEYNNDKKLHKKLTQSVEMTIDKLYPNNYYVYALHTDTSNPHVHLILGKKDIEKNKNIHLDKKAIRKIKHNFSKELIERGINVQLELEQARFKKRLNQNIRAKAPNVYKLVNHGADFYEHDKKNDISYFIEYVTKTGRSVKIWGINLGSELLRSGAKVGQDIKIEKTQVENLGRRHKNYWNIEIYDKNKKIERNKKPLEQIIIKDKSKEFSKELISTMVDRERTR